MRQPLYILLSITLILLTVSLGAQDRLKTMPGYEQYQKMRGQINGSVRGGTLTVTWLNGGKAFEYSKDGKRWQYDIATGKATEAGAGDGRRRTTTRLRTVTHARVDDAAAGAVVADADPNADGSSPPRTHRTAS